MSMRWRLLGSFLLVILIALGTVAVVTRYTTQQEVQTFLRHGGQVGLETLSENLESYYQVNGTWTGVSSVFRVGGSQGRGGQGQRSGVNAPNTNNRLVDEKGVVILSPISDEIGTRLSDSVLSRSIPLEVSGDVVGYLIPEGGFLELPDNFESLLVERVMNASMIAAAISGGIAILLALILAALILKPVRSLTKAAEKMSQGDLSQRVAVEGSGEMAVLGATFNQMSQSLQDAESRRKALTADIAHELRNPLAVQRAHLEALQDGVYPLTQDNLTPIAEQNQQLTRLVEDLRTLALAESGELAMNIRQIDLTQVCTETIGRFEPQAIASQISLQADCGAQACYAMVDRERLQQILDNLIHNALRYAPVDGVIRLTLQCRGRSAVFEVFNDGQQIPEDAMPHLFERFYRADRGRDRASGGTGLGLAIARELAEAHGGSLTGKNHPEGGVVFSLTLPVQ